VSRGFWSGQLSGASQALFLRLPVPESARRRGARLIRRAELGVSRTKCGPDSVLGLHHAEHNRKQSDIFQERPAAKEPRYGHRLSQRIAKRRLPSECLPRRLPVQRRVRGIPETELAAVAGSRPGPRARKENRRTRSQQRTSASQRWEICPRAPAARKRRLPHHHGERAMKNSSPRAINQSLAFTITASIILISSSRSPAESTAVLSDRSS